MTDYNEVLTRIKKIYSSVDAQEQKLLMKILEEIYDTGESRTYEEIWLADYKEIPVDKYTFLTHDKYLGRTNDGGKSIYPAWMDVMMELERTKNQYYEIVFTGATRTGKTSTAVSDAAYQLYKLMCLRDPQAYFGLKSVTNILVFFFNLTTTLAKGVAFKEFNATVSFSPWFMEHGKMSQSEKYPTYIPEGGLIEIAYGSDASHALGSATYCVVGNTPIHTKFGICNIEDAIGIQDVAQVNESGDIVFSKARVACTGYTSKTIKLELEDGTIIEGTPDHKILLTTGEYRKLCDLDESCEIQTF